MRSVLIVISQGGAPLCAAVGPYIKRFST
jgi:hypothetical protein